MLAALTGPKFDAFGRLRVSNVSTLFDSQNRFQADPQYSTSTSGGGLSVYDSNRSSVDLRISELQPSSVTRQTLRSFSYQPGKGMLVMASFVMTAGQSSQAVNLTQRVGFFNAENGVFFQNKQNVNSFVVRTFTSGVVDDARTVVQADWNVDKLDGSGPSNVILDITKAQLLFTDFEWSGAGQIRCGFIVNGRYVVCHVFENANNLSQVYMTTATLPIRYEISSSAATGGLGYLTLTQICSTVIAEGNYSKKSALNWVRPNFSSFRSIGIIPKPITAMRLKSTRTGAVVIPAYISAMVAPSLVSQVEFILLKNPTLSGVSVSYSSLTDTVESLTFNTTADVTFTASNVVYSFFLVPGRSVVKKITRDEDYNLKLQLGTTLGGVSDTYVLAAKTGSLSVSVVASLGFYDLTD